MAMLDALNFGPSGALRFSRNTGRSLTGEGLGAIRYPSPFFDIAQTYLPTSFKTMLRWCRYYFLTNPLINAVCYKMAEYPVTDLIFDSKSTHDNERWRVFFNEVLHFKKFEVEMGLDYNCYGNSFVSIYFPFHKMLSCKKCGHARDVRKQKYIFREYKFVGECERCKSYGEFDVRDHYVQSAKQIRLIRWNPEYITIEHNEATEESRYYYVIPPSLANDVRMAKRHVIETIPQAFIEALRQNKALLFSRSNIYHMARPTIAQKDRGWGMPMILPVLKDTFYLQVLRKAQEAIAIEHVVPLRLLFPQTSSASADVYSSINLSQWRDKVEQELIRWRLDNNYIPILPVPIGQQTLGGDGRALMLAQEYRQWSEHIVSGMGAPVEFIFGGLSFSGSNVSLRMLENHFLDVKSFRLRLVTEFLMPQIGAFMGWEPVPCHYKRFRMADDLQRSALFLQYNQAGKISDRSLLEDTDWDSEKEMELIELERRAVLESQRRQALSQAAIQGESQLIMSKYQTRAQKVMQEMMAPPPPPQEMQATDPGAVPAEASPAPTMEIPPGPLEDPSQAQNQDSIQSQLQSQIGQAPAGGYDVMMLANKIVSWLNQLPDHEKARELSAMQANNPHLYSIILPMLQASSGAERSSAAMPLPEQKPPRRGPESALV
jgi:hypothetical protein